MERRSAVFGFALLILICATGAILLAETRLVVQKQTRAEEFQNLVGGLGFGPSLDLSNGGFSFDPRLDASDTLDPFPTGSFLGPDPAISIFNYPTPHFATSGPRGMDGHAPVP